MRIHVGQLGLASYLADTMWCILPVVLRKPLLMSLTESADDKWQKSILNKCV